MSDDKDYYYQVKFSENDGNQRSWGMSKTPQDAIDSALMLISCRMNQMIDKQFNGDTGYISYTPSISIYKCETLESKPKREIKQEDCRHLRVELKMEMPPKMKFYKCNECGKALLLDSYV